MNDKTTDTNGFSMVNTNGFSKVDMKALLGAMADDAKFNSMLYDDDAQSEEELKQLLSFSKHLPVEKVLRMPGVKKLKETYDFDFLASHESSLDLLKLMLENSTGFEIPFEKVGKLGSDWIRSYFEQPESERNQCDWRLAGLFTMFEEQFAADEARFNPVTPVAGAPKAPPPPPVTQKPRSSLSAVPNQPPSQTGLPPPPPAVQDADVSKKRQTATNQKKQKKLKKGVTASAEELRGFQFHEDPNYSIDKRLPHKGFCDFVDSLFKRKIIKVHNQIKLKGKGSRQYLELTEGETGPPLGCTFVVGGESVEFLCGTYLMANYDYKAAYDHVKKLEKSSGDKSKGWLGSQILGYIRRYQKYLHNKDACDAMTNANLADYLDIKYSEDD